MIATATSVTKLNGTAGAQGYGTQNPGTSGGSTQVGFVTNAGRGGYGYSQVSSVGASGAGQPGEVRITWQP